MLNKIFEYKKLEVAAHEKEFSMNEMRERAALMTQPSAFLETLRQPNPPGKSIKLIAEVKKASPSQGLIRSDFSPIEIASEYESAGADCLSVLTDEKFFQGDFVNIGLAKLGAKLPVLRKDFIFCEYQVFESKVIRADAILLIAAMLEPSVLADLYSTAKGIGLDVLIEVHSEVELEEALAVKPDLIGVNNRDLATFQTDLATTERLIPLIPKGVVKVSESAIETREDVERATQTGADAVLIGTTFCASPDIGAKVRSVMGW